jgi:hypothetical protein
VRHRKALLLDAALVNTLRDFVWSHCTRGAEPGRYVVRPSPPPRIPAGLILTEVSFTVEPYQSAKPKSASRPSAFPEGSSDTSAAGEPTASAMPSSLMEGASEQEWRKRSDELVWMLGLKE